jgi:putative hydrolase of the HAD superfamily
VADERRATKAVLFDLDDTIFDHQGTSRRALSAVQAATPLGRFTLDELEHRHAQVLEVLHRGGVMQGFVSVDAAREERFRRLLRQAGAEPTDDAVRAVARTYRKSYLAGCQLVTGADALLRALRPRVHLGIVSNNILSEQEDKLERFGLRPLIDVLVVSAEEGVSKPEPDIFRAALARLGCEADEAVMVGDTWAADIVGAANAGLRAVWFNRRGEPSPDPELAVEIRSLEPAAVIAKVILNGEPQGEKRHTHEPRQM